MSAFGRGSSGRKGYRVEHLQLVLGSFEVRNSEMENLELHVLEWIPGRTVLSNGYMGQKLDPLKKGPRLHRQNMWAVSPGHHSQEYRFNTSNFTRFRLDQRKPAN
jgi:hypothetical protein